MARSDTSGRPTMVDVARMAKVALSTVSRVVNGDPGARPETIERVNAAILSLGWEADERARQLRRGETGTLGAAARNIGDPFIRAFERAAGALGLMLLSASTSDSEAKETAVIKSLCRRRVDGLVVEPIGDDHSYLAGEIENGLAVVAIDRPFAGVEADAVFSDNRSGIRVAYAHLAAAGHHRIAYIGDTERIFTGRERAATFRRCAGRRGSSYDGLVFTLGVDRTSVRTALDALFSSSERPTALIAGNGDVVTESLLYLGPDFAGMALVGFDDLNFAELVRPALTVIAHDYEAIGGAAVRLLMARREDRTRPVEQIVVPVSLIVRGSGERAPRADISKSRVSRAD
jgi:LacI family transcriptional regulator